jgi:hypothetical protein
MPATGSGPGSFKVAIRSVVSEVAFAASFQLIQYCDKSVAVREHIICRASSPLRDEKQPRIAQKHFSIWLRRIGRGEFGPVA